MVTKIIVIKKSLRRFYGAFLLIFLFGLSGCATYYEKNLKFQEAYQSGDLERANRLLDKNSKAAEGKNRLLFYMQKGVVLQMLGQFEESNKYFEEAYTHIEDYKNSYGARAFSLLTNPATQTYMGEDHEKVLIHYYKALNYLQLGEPQSALVEARRLNNKLNELNDKYEGKKNRYQDDALAHILMGLAYEMERDYNNAFIAYRNAYTTYTTSYSGNFGLSAPEQLKKDILRTAYKTGFMEEYNRFQKEFGLNYPAGSDEEYKGELIFFWHNGLGPVKAENSINFTIVKGKGGMVTFVNEEMGLNFPFPLPRDENKESGGLGDLKLIRVAFPKYLQRQAVFHSAKLSTAEKEVELEKVESVNAIAVSILEDRMLREMGNSLLRLALKQSAEEAVRSQNQDAGAILSILNAVTEKADTRNWQTLPHSIYYSRLKLPEGENKVNITARGTKGNKVTEEFTFKIEKGKTMFFLYSTLDSEVLK